MGSVSRRVERLEARLGSPAKRSPSSESLTEERTKAEWLQRMKLLRHDLTYSLSEQLVCGLIRLFRMQGHLTRENALTTEDLRARLLAWRPPRDPRAIERVLARAIYRREEGTENMECPPEWVEAFEAADELRERCMAAPAEHLAEIFVFSHEAQQLEEKLEAKPEGADEDLEEALRERLAVSRETRERLGIAEGLELVAVGPDVGEISEEEAVRRLYEILSDMYFGEKGYEIQQEIYRLMEERSEES